jgi:hypothetical protein
MRTAAVVVGVALGVSTVLTGQDGANSDVLAKIRTEGMERSQARVLFRMLTDEIGPRLTASPAQKRASEYARERLASFGLADARLEPWTFGRGWTLDRLTVEMIEPRYLPLIAYADGWSSPTPGEIVAAPVLVGGRAPAEVQALGAKLKGAIVMTQPTLSNFVRRDRPQPSDAAYVPNSAAYATSVGRGQVPPPAPSAGTTSPAQQVTAVLREAGAGVVIKPSIGEHGTVFVTGRDQGPGSVPAVTVAAEQYNMIARLIERQVPVRLRVNVQSQYHDSEGGRAYNVIAELPGTDAQVRDEIVMIGAHIDSWHTGTGATDNADASAVVIEAMRILKAVDARPRRTIRVALWSGEEQGLLGSRAWVAQHLSGAANAAARERFNVYFNMDNGYGQIYGFYLQNSEAVRPIFDAWLKPLTAIGARRNVLEGVGSTDHLSFIEAGVPGFNPIQEYKDYDVRTHHTNVDTVERVHDDDLKQAAVVMATFAYQAASADRKIPR